MNEKLNNTHIYQAFIFDNRIKERFSTGKSFLAYRDNMNKDELVDLAHDIVDEGIEGFMPKLVSEIESLLGEGNFIYDFWEFGPDCFSLYWWIDKSVYNKKMEIISKWVEYNEMDGLIEIEKEVLANR